MFCITVEQLPPWKKRNAPYLQVPIQFVRVHGAPLDIKARTLDFPAGGFRRVAVSGCLALCRCADTPHGCQASQHTARTGCSSKAPSAQRFLAQQLVYRTRPANDTGGGGREITCGDGRGHQRQHCCCAERAAVRGSKHGFRCSLSR